ncbi:MAG TPA: hypothetical protein VLI55_09670 [Bryobacteraceae bacterium]|nr:hypothetical protein [Bryobacteraceae bacterium]
MSTQAQIAANQKNAQFSTGPTSEAGKTKSSLNAVKTGLTGRTVLLPGDDAALYEAHVSEFIQRLQPAADDERNLVQSLADTEWRLLRIPSLEMGIYALGRPEFAEIYSVGGIIFVIPTGGLLRFMLKQLLVGLTSTGTRDFHRRNNAPSVCAAAHIMSLPATLL